MLENNSDYKIKINEVYKDGVKYSIKKFLKEIEIDSKFILKNKDI